jgi:ribosomal protein L18E
VSEGQESQADVYLGAWAFSSFATANSSAVIRANRCFCATISEIFKRRPSYYALSIVNEFLEFDAVVIQLLRNDGEIP